MLTGDTDELGVTDASQTEPTDDIITDPLSVASTDLCVSSPQIYDAAMGLMSLQSPQLGTYSYIFMGITVYNCV